MVAQDTAREYDTILYAPVISKGIDSWKAPQPTLLSGKIEELDSEKFVYVDLESKRHDYPSNRVQSVVVKWATPEAAEVHQLWTNRTYAEVVRKTAPAVKSGVPQWQQKLLIAQLCDALQALGRTKNAGAIFVESLAPNRPPAMIYISLPLCWTSREPDAELTAAARTWLQSSEPSAQLLGASWLLLGNDFTEARKTLEQLQGSENETIAKLAVMQLWRLVPPPETLKRLEAWYEFRDRLMLPLQLGATEFIAERLMRVNEVDMAIGQWSRIASLHAERYHRSLVALETADRQLQELGRTEDSKRLKAWIKQFQPAQ